MKDNKKLMPELRFPEFEDKWEKEVIKKLLTIGSGKDYKHLKKGNIPVYGTGGLMTKVDDFLYNGESVGIGRKGTIDKPVFLNNKFWTVDTLFYTHSFKNSIPKFIYYQFLRINWKLHNEASGVPSLSKRTIEKIKLKIPSIPEQQKIANFLTAIDNRIQTLEKKKTLLEQYKKGMMQKIFSQEIRFRDDDGKAFVDWEVRKLGMLTKKVGKKNKENIPYPIYSINNKEGFLPQGEQFEGMNSNDRGYDISLYKIIKEKTFAYNPARINVGSIGFSGNLNNIIVSSLYVCFITSDNLEDIYLLHYLDSYNFNKAVLRNVEGGVRQYLFYDNFSAIKIPLPTKKEQLKISNYFTVLDKKIELVNQQIDYSKTYKKGLLQKMFV